MTRDVIKQNIKAALNGAYAVSQFEKLLREVLKSHADENRADGWTREAEEAEALLARLK